MAATCNISTFSDADYFRGFSYQQTDGTPIDLSDSTLRMGIRDNAADVTEVMLLTSENGGIVITDPPNGKFTVAITQAQLEQLPPGNYVHSLIRTVGSLQLAIWYGSLTHAVGPSR
jgi:hypothetical protein